jgi:hypothetical protein
MEKSVPTKCYVIHALKTTPDVIFKKKVKLSRYTPWRHMGGEEV